MTRTWKMMGIAAAALFVAGTAVVVQSERSHATVKSGPCAEGTFEWRWNLPGSACEAKAD